MTKPVTIPNTFATATTAIPLSQLDSDFSTVATALNDANTYSNYAADTGVVNAYVVTLTGVSTTYSAGLRIQFKAGNANTGASTLNVNGGGTKNITFQDASALSSGTIAANAIVDVMYDGTQFLLMNDPAGTVGTGDVVGPTGATGNAAAIFDSTTGKLIKDSKVIITPVANSSTLTIANNKTVTVNNTLTLSGTDSTTMTFPNTSATIARTDSAQTFTGVQTLSSNPILSGGTANGVLYLNGSSVATSGSALTFDGTTFQYTGAANFATSSGNVGIGTSSPAAKLDVTTAYVDPNATAHGTVEFNSNSSFAINKGGSISLGGAYTGTSTTQFGSILGAKENSTDGNYAGYLSFQTRPNGNTSSERMRLDSSGNLGLGVTPSAWSSGYKALEFGSGSIYGRANATDIYMSSNSYLGASTFIYKYTGAASYYAQAQGGHYWFNAPSGTAGNAITFTQAMTLDASGQLALGRTSVTDLGSNIRTVDMDGTSGAGFRLRANGTNILNLYASSTAVYMAAPANVPIAFETNNTERARITSGGDFRVKGAGTAGSTDAFQVSGSAPANAARIDSSGNFLVGTTTAGAGWGAGGKLTVDMGSSYVILKNSNGSSSPPLLCWNAIGTEDDLFIIFATETGGTTRGTIDYNRAGGLTRYNTTSDYRAKTVNGPVENALSRVALLKPCTGRMNEATEDIDFFVAHELQEVVPSAVTGEKDAVNEDGSPKYQMVDKSAIIPLLTAAIQEQQALITALTARVAALEGTQP